MQSLDSFSSLKSFKVNNSEYNYFSLKNFFEDFNINIDSVPYCLKILIENILRNENPKYMSKANIKNAFHKFTEKNNLGVSKISTDEVIEKIKGLLDE